LKLSLAEIAAVLGYLAVVVLLAWPRRERRDKPARVWPSKPWPRRDERSRDEDPA